MSLSITLFGPFSVAKDGQPITTFRTDALRALLAILALERGRAQRRESLAHLLSPERPDKEALTYLRNRLTRLRKTIGDEKADPPYLEINRKEIMLHEHVDVDVADFVGLVNAVRHHPHRAVSSCPTCIKKLNLAGDLYKGELLAGFGLENEVWQSWLTQKREQFKVDITDLLDMLSEIALKHEEWERLSQYGRRMIEIDRWHEPAYRHLMRAAFMLGERTEALGWYETCERLLYEELGTDPDAETLALHADILGGDQISEESLALSAEAPYSLPIETTPFVGRTQEKQQGIDLLVNPKTRLLTIVGIGGVGKSRLGAEIGEALRRTFPDGVWFVPFASVSPDEEAIYGTILSTLRLGVDPQRKVADQLIDFLKDKQLLLIIDNMEHLLEESDFVSLILQRAVQVAILATSREPLNFSFETVINLQGLRLDGGNLDSRNDEIDYSEAVELFVQSAKRARADFKLDKENLSLVQTICTMVLGSPLGINLAAAWVRRRSLKQIVNSIRKSTDFLASRLRDMPARHRSIRAVFDSSWEMLDTDDRTNFAALSVFQGSFTMEAVENVIGASIFDVDALIEKSLVSIMPGERFVLHPLLREYAQEKCCDDLPRFELLSDLQELASEIVDRSALDYLEHRHRAYYFAYLITHGQKLYGMQPHEGLAQLLGEIENIEKAWETGLRQGTFDALYAGAEYLGEFYLLRGKVSRGEEIFRETADQFGQQEGESTRYASINRIHARFYLFQSEYDRCIHQVSLSIQLAQTTENHIELTNSRLLRGHALREKGDIEGANRELEAGLNMARDLDESLLIGQFCRQLGGLRYEYQNRFEEAEQLLTEALSRYQAIHYLRGIAECQNNLGLNAQKMGNPTAAGKMLNDALTTYTQIGDLPMTMRVRFNLGNLLMAQSSYWQAHLIFSDVLKWQDFTGNHFHRLQILISAGTAERNLVFFYKWELYLKSSLVLSY
ncbi:MAG: BTAD domain-containing putative transcriptional regulator [Chloroflexota bacterium]